MASLFLKLESYLEFLGSISIFIKKLGRAVFFGDWSLRSLCEQIWLVTVQSSTIVVTAGTFVGAIMTLQFGLQMKMFDALGLLGGISTSGTIREVGPLLIAFLLSGKIGAFTTAEVGAMKVNDQLDAIQCLGIDPVDIFLVPRWLGIVIASFILLIFGLFSSVLGGLIVGGYYFGLDPFQYLSRIPEFVTISSILSGAFKCLVFSFCLSSVSLYFGYHASGGARGVGRAVLNTAVLTMVLIVLFDWLTSQLWLQIVGGA